MTLEEMKVEAFNKTKGNLHLADAYECQRCNNKGLIYKLREGEVVSFPCECMNVRRSIRLLKESGLQLFVQSKSLGSYEADYQWQKDLKKITQKFIEQDEIKWFFIGGQVGIGKTHLCTSICGNFIEKGMPTRYMLWTDISKKLKANINDDSYYDIIKPYKDIEVLYIDDFFKVRKGQLPTNADVNIAFDILNSRLFDENKVTIISSEFTIDQLMPIDEGTISRIIEKAKQFVINIGDDITKNYRLKNRS